MIEQEQLAKMKIGATSSTLPAAKSLTYPRWSSMQSKYLAGAAPDVFPSQEGANGPGAISRYLLFGNSVGAVNFPEVDLRAITADQRNLVRVCHVH